MNNPIRIAQVLGNFNYGGIEMMIMNYYRNLDKNLFQFDFICYEESICPFEKEIYSLGGNVIRVPNIKKYKEYKNALIKIFNLRKYQIVHAHMTTLNFIPLSIAKDCGIEYRISHSHSTTNKNEILRNFIKNILRHFSTKYASNYLACGYLSGIWLYGKKNEKSIKIIPNAVDFQKYQFDQAKSQQVKKLLGLKETDIVIGTVGRLVKQKNYIFLLKVFKELISINETYKLVIIGDGKQKTKLSNFVLENNINDRVLFIESTDQAYIYYNAFDIFVLPSLYEGFPLVGIEAQVNGLISLLSNKIDHSIKLTDRCSLLALNVDTWVEKILSFDTEIFQNENRHNKVDTDFDITHATKILENLYIELLKKEK